MTDTQKDLDSGEYADVQAAWAAEIERRITEVESGEVETVGWEEARSRIRATLEKRHLLEQ